MAVATTTVRLTVAGRPRSAQVWLPEQPSGAALVLDLHGSGFDPDRHALAARTERWAGWGAVVVAPCATIPFRFDPTIAPGWAWSVPGAPLPWADPSQADTDDVGDLEFLDGLVDEAARRWGVDTTRVHALGFSGGARLLSHWAWRARRLRAVCCVSGVRIPSVDTVQRPPVPLLAIHGDGDQVNPLRGGDGRRWHEPVPDVVERWASALGATRRVTDASPGVTRSRWYGPGPSPAVEYLEIAGGGHGWPGATEPEHVRLFGTSDTLDATAAAAGFFGIT